MGNVEAAERNMIKLVRLAVCASIALGVFGSPLWAAPKFTLFQIPGNFQAVRPVSITNGGEVVCNAADYHGNEYSFIRSPDGTLTEFDVPGSSSTTITSENENGTIAGYYRASDRRTRGFLRLKDGTIETFAVGERERGATEPVAVNNAGWIAIDKPSGGITGTAYLRDPSGKLKKFGYKKVPTALNSTNSTVGYVYSFDDNGWLRDPDGTITALDFYPRAINDAGTIVGYRGIPEIGIYRTADGAEITIKGPGYSTPSSLNNRGVVGGTYFANFYNHGFLWGPSTQIETSNFVTVDVPGAAETIITAINDNSDVVGTYQTPDRTFGLFIRNP
jgi:hypothetical protein